MKFTERIKINRRRHRLWRKDCKNNAKISVKRNYIACLAVCFIMVFIAGEYSSTISGISTYNKRHVANLKFNPDEKKEIVLDMIESKATAEQTSEKWDVDNPKAVEQWYNAYQEEGDAGLDAKELTFFGSTQDGSNTEEIFDIYYSAATVRNKVKKILGKAPDSINFYFEGISNNETYQNKFINAVFSILLNERLSAIAFNFASFFASLLFAVFITNLLVVSERRFFLENRTYKNTKPGRLGFLFRERTIHPAKTMFVKSIYYTLWCFTIVGGFVKSYSYAMVPFILAENPNAKTNKVITLSRRLMKGHKWELFKLDVSMLGWAMLSMLSLGVVGVLFVNPYSTAVKTEFYIKLRREAIENNIQGCEILNDKYLDLDLLEEQMEQSAKEKGFNPDSARFTPAFTISIPESEFERPKKEGQL